MKRILLGLLLTGCAVAAAAQTPAMLADLPPALALLGPEVVVRPIDAPVIHQPALWLGRPAGRYRFTVTQGKDPAARDQFEDHEPDAGRPAQVWRRHIGDALTEALEVRDDHTIRLYEEIDHTHGYRVALEPGIAIPAGVKAGDRWETSNTLEAFALSQPDKVAYRGTLRAVRRYVGAYRVRVPAGEFDTVLLEEVYDIQVGPLKASDTRHIFYARGLGIVAEVEGIRASALIVFRMQEKSARLLAALPTGASPITPPAAR